MRMGASRPGGGSGHRLGVEFERDGLGRAYGQQRLVAAGYRHRGGEHAHGAGELLMRERITARAAVAGHGAYLYHGVVCVTLHLHGQEALGGAGGAVEMHVSIAFVLMSYASSTGSTDRTISLTPKSSAC